MANPNDVNASIILEDKTSAVLKKVDENTKKTAEVLTKEIGKTKGVFDKLNFSVNASALAMKGFRFILSRNEELQDDFNESLDFMINRLNQAADAFKSISLSHGLWSKAMGLIKESNAADDVAAINSELAKFDSYVKRAYAVGPLWKMMTGGGIENKTAIDAIAKAEAALTKSLTESANRARAISEIMAASGLSKKSAEILFGEVTRETNKEAKKLPEHISEATKETFNLIEAQRLLKEETEEVEEAFRQTFGGGFRRETEAAAQQFQNLGAIGAKTASNMHGAFADNFFGAMRGEFRSMRDFGLSMMDALLAGLQRQIADFVASGILSFLGTIFSPGAPGLGSALARNRGLPIFGGGGSDSPYGGGTGFIPSPSDLGGVGSSNISAPTNVYNVNINAVDAQSFEALAVRNPRAIAAAVQASLNTSPSFRAAVAGA